MPNTAMIFAAGRGTRMGALTRALPKPLISVAGKPLIDHAFALIDDSPIEKTVVNVHHFSDLVVQHLSNRNIIISREDDELLETGGGLKKALTQLNSDAVVTLNSDAIWTGRNPVRALLKAWDPDRMDALLMLVDPKNAVGHKGQGDFLMSPKMHLKRGAGLTYSGCQIIKTAAVAEIVEDAFSLNVVWDKLLAQRRIFGTTHNGKWCDVGHPEGIELAERMLGSNDV